MSKNDSKKTCFLFGAGTEVDFNLCNGIDFAKNVVGLKNDIMNTSVKNFYMDMVKQLDDEKKKWYPSPQNCHLKFPEKVLLKSSIKKQFLEDFMYSDFTTQEKFNSKVEQELQKHIIKKRSKKQLKKSGYELIEKYTSYMGLIDEKFHTIICPLALGPHKFWDVIFCYTRAYLSLVSKIYSENEYYQSTLTNEYYTTILNNPQEVLKKFKTFCQKNKDTNSYYKALKNYKDKIGSNNITVITTNYTPLCSEIAEINDDNIAYIHGRIGWFESPYELKIYSIIEKNLKNNQSQILPNNDIYFPYIFIQSGIKPVIDKTQIEEYSKMLKFLKNANRLIILGYKINCDDNHINTILKSYIEDNENLKETIYIKYKEKNDNKNEEASKKEILSLFRLTSEKCPNFKVVTIDGSKSKEENLQIFTNILYENSIS